MLKIDGKVRTEILAIKGLTESEKRIESTIRQQGSIEKGKRANVHGSCRVNLREQGLNAKIENGGRVGISPRRGRVHFRLKSIKRLK